MTSPITDAEIDAYAEAYDRHGSRYDLTHTQEDRARIQAGLTAVIERGTIGGDLIVVLSPDQLSALRSLLDLLVHYDELAGQWHGMLPNALTGRVRRR